MKRTYLTTILGLGMFLAGPAAASTVYSQGFETDANGWFDGGNGGYGIVTRETGGIGAYEGSYYGRFEDVSSGPYSYFDSYRDTFPGDYTASVAVYLDTNWSIGSGFDYSVASSDSSGNHLRDFIFHVTKDTSTGNLLVGGSNNTNFAPQEGLENGNHYVVQDSGWYILEHVFKNMSGSLTVDLNLLDDSSNLLFTETRNNPFDVIPSVVGGNRYGWFSDISIDGGIAVDNIALSVPSPVPLPASFPLLLGALGLGVFIGRRRKKTQLA